MLLCCREPGEEASGAMSVSDRLRVTRADASRLFSLVRYHRRLPFSLHATALMRVLLRSKPAVSMATMQLKTCSHELALHADRHG